MKTIQYDTGTITYKAAQLWELLPYDIKNSPTLIELKDGIKTMSPSNCPCGLCKTHLKNIGYVDIGNTFSVTYDHFPLQCIGSGTFGCLNTHTV